MEVIYLSLSTQVAVGTFFMKSPVLKFQYGLPLMNCIKLFMFRQLNDRAGMGRAFGNIGNAYSAMGYYEQAIKYHMQELTISKVDIT